MRQFFRNNGLSIVMLGIFLLLWVGQALVGWQAYNEDLKQHNHLPVPLLHYFARGHFWEATGENWESEFLQMAAYVFLTAFLVQKGSSESREPNEPAPQDEDPRRHQSDPRAPWPVRKGGLWLRLYSHSLTIAFVLLFLASFTIHLLGGAAEHRLEEMEHGQPDPGIWQFLWSWQFWFQSLQNWQSEFLAVASMVILSIFLRQKGSPESKPVHAPHWQTAE